VLSAFPAAFSNNCCYFYAKNLVIVLPYLRKTARKRAATSESGANSPNLNIIMPKTTSRPERAAVAFLKPHRLFFLFLIACVGACIAAAVVYFVSVSETADANRAFALEFSDRVDVFRSFFRTRLLCLRAAADAVSQLGGTASSAVISKVRKQGQIDCAAATPQDFSIRARLCV
jgi:hypothetical protein